MSDTVLAAWKSYSSKKQSLKSECESSLGEHPRQGFSRPELVVDELNFAQTCDGQSGRESARASVSSQISETFADLAEKEIRELRNSVGITRDSELKVASSGVNRTGMLAEEEIRELRNSVGITRDSELTTASSGASRNGIKPAGMMSDIPSSWKTGEEPLFTGEGGHSRILSSSSPAGEKQTGFGTMSEAFHALKSSNSPIPRGVDLEGAQSQVRDESVSSTHLQRKVELVCNRNGFDILKSSPSEERVEPISLVDQEIKINDQRTCLDTNVVMHVGKTCSGASPSEGRPESSNAQIETEGKCVDVKVPYGVLLDRERARVQLSQIQEKLESVSTRLHESREGAKCSRSPSSGQIVESSLIEARAEPSNTLIEEERKLTEQAYASLIEEDTASTEPQAPPKQVCSAYPDIMISPGDEKVDTLKTRLLQNKIEVARDRRSAIIKTSPSQERVEPISLLEKESIRIDHDIVAVDPHLNDPSASNCVEAPRIQGRPVAVSIVPEQESILGRLHHRNIVQTETPSKMVQVDPIILIEQEITLADHGVTRDAYKTILSSEDRVEPVSLTENEVENVDICRPAHRNSAHVDMSLSAEGTEIISFLTEAESKLADHDAPESDNVAVPSSSSTSGLPKEKVKEVKAIPPIDKWTELQLNDMHSTREGFERRFHKLSTCTVSAATAGRAGRDNTVDSPLSSNFSCSVDSAAQRTVSAPSTPRRQASSSPKMRTSSSEGRAHLGRIERLARIPSVSRKKQMGISKSACPQVPKQSNSSSQSSALPKQKKTSSPTRDVGDSSNAKRIEKMLLSHIGAMDAFATGLRDAARICQESVSQVGGSTSGPQHYSIATPGREFVNDAHSTNAREKQPSLHYKQPCGCVYEEHTNELAAPENQLPARKPLQLPQESLHQYPQDTDAEKDFEKQYLDAKQLFLEKRKQHLFSNEDSTDHIKVKSVPDIVAGHVRSLSPQIRDRTRTREISLSDKVPEVHLRLHESAEAQRARRSALQEEWQAYEDRELTFHPQVKTVQNTPTASTVYSRLSDDAARRRKVDDERARQRRPPAKAKVDSRVKPLSCGAPILQKQQSGSRTMSGRSSPSVLSELLPQWFGGHERAQMSESPAESHTPDPEQNYVLSESLSESSVPEPTPQKPTMRLEAHAEAASAFGGFVLC